MTLYYCMQIHDISICDDVPNVSGDLDLAFVTPGESLALFTITMNGKYRKPWRVYILQAPSHSEREQWLQVRCTYAGIRRIFIRGEFRFNRLIA
eukprot:SAG22_NODE_1174_length_5252_cov_177.072579_8_plen_94_part_00